MGIPLLKEISDLPRDVRASARNQTLTTAVFALFPQIAICVGFAFAGSYNEAAFANALDSLVHNGELFMIAVALLAPLAYGIAFRNDLPCKPAFLASLIGVLAVATIGVVERHDDAIRFPALFYLTSVAMVIVTMWVLFCEFAFETSTRIDETAAAKETAHEANRFANEFKERNP